MNIASASDDSKSDNSHGCNTEICQSKCIDHL